MPERANAPLRNPDKMIERMDWASLRPLLLGSDADRDVALKRLRLFAVELLRWSQGVSNLISHNDEPRLVDRHIAESLAGASIINKLGCKTLVDFGSGGGFPALPLALAGVGKHWTLVESRRNKTLFLRRALQELGAGDIDILTSRLETLVADDPEGLRCDGFTSRATMKAGPTLELAAQIVEPGGHAILWKGSAAKDELESTDEDWRSAWEEPVVHTIGEGPNSILVFERKK
ncbi:MAG: 16S rRNA (guanine(527)-N(7))-methyltransferase RsmG [Candidatus Eisenbacteria bacterium]